MDAALRTLGIRLLAVLCPLAFACIARAQAVNLLPNSLAQGALGEQVPSAIVSAEFDGDDYAAKRLSGDETRAYMWVERGSVRWVRVASWAVLPRGLLVVNAPGATGGSVTHAGFTHPLVPGKDGARALVPVALLTSDDARIDVEVVRGTVRTHASYSLVFQPRAQNAARVFYDASCSPYGVHVQAGAPPRASWLHVACRLVRTRRGYGTVPTMEMYVNWDGAGEVLLNGASSHARLHGLYVYRVTKGPGKITLSAAGQDLVLAYFIPPEYHAGFVGAGVGPYYYSFDRPKEHVETVVPMVTVYGGYSFTPTARVVYFNATAVHKRGFMDQGLYLHTESVRFFDDRISVHLLLGANLLIYHRVHKYTARINAPQGIEFIFRDFLAVNRNLTVGGFLYPDITGSAYYNAWLRWGSGRFFGELNFLDWRQPHHTGVTKSESLGVTFGMPLYRFL